MPFINPTELMVAVAEDVLVDSFLQESPLFGMLASSVVMQKQKAIEWGEKVSQGTTSGRAITAPLTEDTQAVVKGAAMSIPDWYIKHHIKVLKQDMQLAASNARITDLRNPLRLAMDDALKIFTRKVQQVLYTANGTVDETNAGVFGLNSIAGQTGSYAGIDRTVYPRWKSLRYQGATPGTPEALTVEKFTKIIRDRRTNGVSFRGYQPQRLLIVTTDIIETDVLRKLYAQQTSLSLNDDFYNRNREILPYSQFHVSGIPVISDVDCPANTLYLLNLSKLAIYGFDQSDQDFADENIAYIPMRFWMTDENPNDPQPMESTLWIRIARIMDGHPDVYQFELTTRFQLVAFDPIDSVTKLEDVANS